MYAGFVVIIAISLLFQAAAAVSAMRLIRITGPSKAWAVIALAMLTMAIRRLTILVGVLMDPSTVDSAEWWSEAIGLLIAALLLAGIVNIAPLLRSIQRAKETVQRAHDRLEQEVQQRTADLVGAHNTLHEEFAQRARAEEALRDEHRRLRQVLEMFERDQQLLAYEIHDGFVQPATAAVMVLQAALSRFTTDQEASLENVVRGLQLIQESIAQVRWLISGLRPVLLEDQGLIAAVDKLIHDTESRTEIKLFWSHQVQFDRLAPTVEMSLFRIIQEALRNALRHCQADRVEIALTQSGKTVEARIQDWGCGFDTSVHKRDHFGLEGMQERARLTGGTVQIQSQPGKGTCVTARFPIAEDGTDSR